MVVGVFPFGFDAAFLAGGVLVSGFFLVAFALFFLVAFLGGELSDEDEDDELLELDELLEELLLELDDDV